MFSIENLWICKKRGKLMIICAIVFDQFNLMAVKQTTHSHLNYQLKSNMHLISDINVAHTHT